MVSCGGVKGINEQVVQSMTNRRAGGCLFLVTLFSLGIAVSPYAPPVRASSAAPWSLTGAMTTARVYHTSIVLSDNRVLVIGGVDGAGRILASTELYNPHSGRWSATGRSSPRARSSGASGRGRRASAPRRK